MNRQLANIHPGVDVPAPVGTAFMHWGADPHETGWHFWREGARSSDAAASMVRPDPALPLYVAGEAWSHAQSWAEGALEVAATVAGRILAEAGPDAR